VTGAIDITNHFPPTRKRTVLLELLRAVRSLQNERIAVVICGGWVPFLKQLARENRTAHLMSLDIDLLFRKEAREGAVIDRIRTLLLGRMEFVLSSTRPFRYEKKVEGNLVELDLLADFPRTEKGDPVRRVHGLVSSLVLCLVDGAEDLASHVETIRMSWLEGDRTETCDITVPDQVGFLMLKTEVCRYRETTKDPYDIYYYCRFSEAPDVIWQKLKAAIGEPAVRRTVEALQRMFRYQDCKWVDLALDHMNITGEDREREARFIVKTMAQVTGDPEDHL
jgi:hypothetical protein